MARQSIGDLHSKITADAKQFVSEFQRADNAARRGAVAIDRQVDKLTRGVKRKFAGAKIGESILQGFGLGTGFAVAHTITAKVTDWYREQADFAKSIEESTRHQLEYQERIFDLRRSEEQRLAALEKKQAEALKLAATAAATTARRIVPFYGMGGQAVVDGGVEKSGQTAEQAAEAARQTAEAKKLEFEVERKRLDMQEKARAAALSTAERDRDLRIKSHEEGLRLLEEQTKGQLDAARESNERTARLREANEALADSYRELADPSLRYMKQIEEVNRLQSEGILKANEAADAIVALQDAMASDQTRRVNAELDDFFGEMDDRSREVAHLSESVRDLGWSFSSAFEDAVIGGQKLGDVMRSLAQDVLRMGLRLGVTNPLLNSVVGAFGGNLALPSLFGGARAAGGPMVGGRPYLVGERGPELFVPEHSGDMVPNHAVVSRSGGGDTYVFSPQIAAGVTHQELTAAMPGLFDQFAGMMMDKAQRGGAFRRAFA